MQDECTESTSQESRDKIWLDEEEVRVLGSLMEKYMTTPDYYPMTLNGLKNACNQKSSREPVVAYNDQLVENALDRLRDKKLVVRKMTADSRVPKFAHAMELVYGLPCEQLAILCVLMLRGPQTLGEIRSRSTRMYAFSGLPEVEASVRELVERVPFPLVKLLLRRAGHKEQRFQQLLGHESSVEEQEPLAKTIVSKNPERPDLELRLHDLEQKVQWLTEELEGLRNQCNPL